MKNLRKSLAIILCMVMCLSFLPTAAFAEDGMTEQETAQNAEVPAHEHAYLAEVKEASCTEGGYTTYVCACGESYTDGYTDPLGHTPEAVEEIPASCTEPGRTAGMRCAVCGETLEGCEEIPAQGHTPELVEENPASATEPGRTAGMKCAVCGEILEGCEEIPMLVAEVETAVEEQRVEAPAEVIPVETAEAPAEAIPVETMEAPAEGIPVETAEALPEEAVEGAGEKVLEETVEPSLEETPEPSAILTIEKQPEDTAPIDGVAEFSVRATVSAAAEISYRWERLDESASYDDEEAREAAWEEIEGGTTDTLQLTGLDDPEKAAEMRRFAFRCVIMAEDARAITNEVRVLDPDDGSSEPTILMGEGTEQDRAEAMDAGVTSSGTWGNLNWTLEDTGLLTISGNGEMDSLGYNSAWCAYRYLIYEVKIETGVTNIGSSAFSGCSSLKSVKIPVGVTSIAYDAFSGCSSLTSVEIPA